MELSELQALIEILVLVSTLSAQFPLVGIAAAIGSIAAICLLLNKDSNDDDAGNS